MRIWIDFDNSPHVLFFEPILGRLRFLGHEVILSARNYAQTLALCEQKGFEVKVIGSHGGRNRARKIVSLVSRAWQCRRFARRARPDLAVSHGSRALTVAAWSLGVPVVTLYDYEKASYSLFNRLSRRVLAPALIPPQALREIGLDLRKLRQYSAAKEEVYLAGHSSRLDFRGEFEVGHRDVLLVLRPPATQAHYHVPATDRLYEATLRDLNEKRDLIVVLLSRDSSQIDQARSVLRGSGVRLIIPDSVLDGPGLLLQADLVISGGGTMNREAAILGTPVYSIFRGTIGAVDRHFIECGRMIQIHDETDLGKISILRRRSIGVGLPPNPTLVDSICHEILTAA